MKKNEFIKSKLEEMGYDPMIDDDGDVCFKFERKLVWAIIGNEDEEYILLSMPHIVSVDENKILLHLTACNYVNRTVKIVKVFLTENMENVSVSSGVTYTEESLETILKKNLSVFRSIRTAYTEKLRELEEEMKDDF